MDGADNMLLVLAGVAHVCVDAISVALVLRSTHRGIIWSLLLQSHLPFLWSLHTFQSRNVLRNHQSTALRCSSPSSQAACSRRLAPHNLGSAALPVETGRNGRKKKKEGMKGKGGKGKWTNSRIYIYIFDLKTTSYVFSSSHYSTRELLLLHAVHTVQKTTPRTRQLTEMLTKESAPRISTNF